MDDTKEVDSNKSQNESDKNDKILDGYREVLDEREYKIGESFFKTLLTLSSGALGLSLIFIKDIVGDDPVKSYNILFLAWSMLAASLTSVLLSLYINMTAYRHAIKQVDNRTIYEEAPGGMYGKAMPLFNIFSTLTFSTGVVSLVVFVSKNIGGK